MPDNLDFFRRYADFSGRSCRLEWWFGLLWYCLISLTPLGLAIALDWPYGGLGWPYYHAVYWPYDSAAFITLTTVSIVLGLVLLIPVVALYFRRLHDLGRSGWWVLLAFIPVIGEIAMIIWLGFFKGTPGENRFGPPRFASEN